MLCGSRKYPIKEPFVELMKGSLNTFLNAFTYPDRTCYPVASTNTQVGLRGCWVAGCARVLPFRRCDSPRRHSQPSRRVQHPFCRAEDGRLAPSPCHPLLITSHCRRPQDFYNLVDVYLDAVLHPKCVNDKQTFEQEVRPPRLRLQQTQHVYV